MCLSRMIALSACCRFSIFIGCFLFQRAKPPQGTVLFINQLGKGLTSRACMGDGGSIWCSPARSRWDKEKSYGQKSASDALMLFSLWAILSLQKEMVKELTTLTCTSMYACSCTKYGITRAFFDLCLIGCLEAKPIKTQDKYLQPAQSTGNI